MKIYCTKCKEIKKVIGYKKDDPILSCNHIKEVTKTSTTYCPICDMIVRTFKARDGSQRCGGNLIDNPGCGCSIELVKIPH